MRVIAKILQTLNMNKNFENKDGGPRFGRGSTATRFRNSQSESRMSCKFAAKLTRQHLIRDMYVIVMSGGGHVGKIVCTAFELLFSTLSCRSNI